MGHLAAEVSGGRDSCQISYAFGPFYLNPSEHILLRDGRRLELRPKLFATLVMLVSNAGRLLTKEELLQDIWPGAFVEEVGLARNISCLRRVLRDRGHPPRYVETVPKYGYRFVGHVEEIVEYRTPLERGAVELSKAPG